MDEVPDTVQEIGIDHPQEKEFIKPRQLKMQVILGLVVHGSNLPLFTAPFSYSSPLGWLRFLSLQRSSSHGLQRRMKGGEDTAARVSVLFVSKGGSWN